ncbi:hypothetical protein GOBAR_AA12415 [Gossypium barbadense]|uniref:N-alpha-acetyltransferase 40 n=1 Tax=Gossypium barbadense TaxID=3634 RepID=A0A2P5XY06_GOSBA|nr:hypothetical protein GOBAR_AA12415 [Gossypium barbadense]
MESSRASEKKKLKRKEILEKKKAADQLLKVASAQIDHLTSFPSFCYFNKNELTMLIKSLRGLCLCLESGSGDKLSNCTKQHIQKLLKKTSNDMPKPLLLMHIMLFKKAKTLFVGVLTTLIRSLETTSSAIGSQSWSQAERLCLRLESGRGDKLSNCTKQQIQKLLKANMMGPYGSEWAVEEKVKRREMVAPEARYIFVYWNANEMMDNAFTPLLGFLHFRFTLEEEIPVLYLYELQLDSSVQGKGLG